MKTIVMKSWRLLALLVSVVAVTACEEDDDDVPVARMTTAEFVQQAAASDVFEIEAGKLATANSTTPEVVTFGENLIDDHTETSQTLMTLAHQNSVNVPLPSRQTLPQDKQAILTRLESKAGGDFDLDFVAVQLEAHQQAITLFEKASNELEHQAFRDFAKNTLPTLQAHLEMARKLRTQLSEG
ncbi:DUF4142 domain-containing protein [Pontibacter burrus]|uniref:DUF4142 domain-containing protein n=1 Tax=Pontibacter burrus TaxID=2704466 RepID=A0A6B3LP74_9BACT|nr:DUF4142 domain-containing protein [Pontibacter burrus]NEM97683.1 DUF4142 domain-containing protein [Pontibacter burrus]